MPNKRKADDVSARAARLAAGSFELKDASGELESCYETLGVLGRGAFSVVFLACDARRGGIDDNEVMRDDYEGAAGQSTRACIQHKREHTPANTATAPIRRRGYKGGREIRRLQQQHSQQ